MRYPKELKSSIIAKMLPSNNYEAAKARHPERWTRQTRNWTLINEVWLNPRNLRLKI